MLPRSCLFPLRKGNIGATWRCMQAWVPQHEPIFIVCTLSHNPCVQANLHALSPHKHGSSSTTAVAYTLYHASSPYNVYGVKYIDPVSLAPFSCHSMSVTHTLTWIVPDALCMALKRLLQYPYYVCHTAYGGLAFVFNIYSRACHAYRPFVTMPLVTMPRTPANLFFSTATMPPIGNLAYVFFVLHIL